jgi:hypothetical protein
MASALKIEPDPVLTIGHPFGDELGCRRRRKRFAT